MRRLFLLFLIVILIVLAAGLSRTALDPMAFSGKWYCVENQNPYYFQEGVIYDSGDLADTTDTAAITGAYSYCRDKVLLFAKGIADLETEKEIYLIENSEGSFLCEKKDGTGKIYFSRCN